MRIYFILYTICYAQTCPDCRGDGSDTSLLQVDSRTPPDAPGIIIWSYGRSATGSLKRSLISATGYTYCQNLGEPFADRAPNIQSLQRCMRKGQLLLMVKPQHLFQHGGALQRPQDFFQAAFQAGFRIVVGSFRENQLARDLSSFALMIRNARRRHPDSDYVIDSNSTTVKSHLHYPGIVRHYEELRANYSLGLEAAYNLGYTIVPFSFQDLIRDTCKGVRRTITALRSLKVSQSFKDCDAVATHISPPHANQTVESATNAEVASIVRAELLGTPYQWMLDLDATDWPPGTEPQKPVPTWHMHELISKEGNTFMHISNTAGQGSL